MNILLGRYSVLLGQYSSRFNLVKSKEKVYTFSDVQFSTENIGEEKKKVFIVRDEVPHFLRGPRFQPA